MSGQNVLVDLPSISNGFSRASSIYAAPKQDLEKGVTLSTSLATTYDTNVLQSSGAGGDPIANSLVVSPGLTGSYLAGSSSWLLGASFSATYDEYLDVTDIGGLNYNTSIFGGYRGGKLIASSLSDFGFNNGINRFLSQNIEQFDISNRIIARYSFSPKTSIIGSLSHRSTIYQTNGFNDTSSFNAGLSAMWNATPLTDIGPQVYVMA